MVRSDEDGEEGGERKGEDAEHFDSAPWMSEQREEAGGSNRRMMETIVVEALRNLWGNINEELLVLRGEAGGGRATGGGEAAQGDRKSSCTCERR